MQSEFVVVERTETIATVTINRPDKLNALNAQVLAGLERAFGDLAAADGSEPVRVAILTGAGKAFVAGACGICARSFRARTGPSGAFVRA